MSLSLPAKYAIAALAGAAMGTAIGMVLPKPLGLFAAPLLAGAATWLVSLGDTKLLQQMVAVCAKLERTEQPQPLPTNRTDVIGELAAAINRLFKRDKAVEQANSDALTGLANRRGLLQKLEYAFKRKQPLALFYIDLDKFKPINDTYGHEMGDAVLKRVAELFLANVRENDIVARLGGDEFVLVMLDLTDRALLSDRATKILATISEPMWVNDVRVKIGGSIGITVAPQDGETVEALMAAADETMYAVKKAGRNNFKFYS
jgi:diguanylate cyclase (GGDEF)-like protein